MKFVVEVDGKDVTLDKEQARKLHGELDEIFGRQEVIRIPFQTPPYLENTDFPSWSEIVERHSR